MRVVTSIFYKRGELGCLRPTLLALLALFVVRLTSFIVVNRTYIHVLLYRSTAKKKSQNS